MKRFLSAVIAVIIIVGAITPVSAATTVIEAIEEWDYTLSEDGDTVMILSYYNNLAKSITIPSKLGGKKVTAIGNSVFSGSAELTSVKIPDGVKTLGRDVFSFCRNLKIITIPDSVEKIGGGAFDSTAWYESNPNGVVYAGKVAYEYKGTATQGTKITLKKGTKGIANKAFKDQKGIVSIKIPDGIISIGDSAFAGCENLKSVNIPDSVKSIGNYAFNSCTSLSSITIGNGVTRISDYAFNKCDSLVSVSIPNNVTTIGKCAFIYCKRLTSVTIGSGVKSIGDDAFNGCVKLTSVTFKSTYVSFDNDVFVECPYLTTINVPNGASAAYQAEPQLGGYIIVEGSTGNGLIYGDYTYAVTGNSVMIVKYNGGGGAASIPSKIDGKNVTAIGDMAFKECTTLTSITIPDSVTIIGMYAFYKSGITSITIPSKVESIGDYAFGNCISLTKVTIDNSKTRIGEYAFYLCKNLNSVSLGNGITRIGKGAFSYCIKLSSIIIPKSVKSIEDYAFEGCVKLTSVKFLSSTPPLLGDKGVFGNCDILKTITIPAGAKAAYGDEALKKLYGSKFINEFSKYKIVEEGGTSGGSKTVDELAREVIAGQWGVKDDRVNRLTAAGYDAKAVQARVNEILSGNGGSSGNTKTTTELAKEVLAGKWGVNPERERRLTAAGYDAKAVQAKVNELLKR